MAVRITPTELVSAAATVAYNEAHTRMAVADCGGRVAVWARDGDSRSWVLSASIALPQGSAPLTRLAWAPPEFGTVLSGGSADGVVWIWDQQPEQAEPPAAGDTAAAGAQGGGAAPGTWQLRARINDSSLSVQALAFAPAAMGPLLAAASADGFVRFYAASTPLAAEHWRLEAELQACPGGGACTALSWREHSPGLPPLLAVGTATEGALLFYFEQPHRRWQRAAALGSREDYGGVPVSAAGWAPTLGRPLELVAVAAAQTVTIWGLRGPADALQVEVVATLPHPAPVSQAEWNLLGTWLAAAAGGRVFMWRPDLAGEWRLLNTIDGSSGGGEALQDGPQAMEVAAA